MQQLKAKNWGEVLNYHAERTPDKIVYEFSHDGEVQTTALTYAQLVQESQKIVNVLGAHGIKPGERVVILYPASLTYNITFFGCLLGGFIAVPVYLAKNLPNLTKLAAILNTCSPSAILTESSTSKAINIFSEQLPIFKNIQLISTDILNLDDYPNITPPEITRDDVAFLQYTSGSTGTPKGAMISHGNLFHNTQSLQDLYQYQPDDKLVSWLPPYHDMGLLGAIIQTTYSGISSLLMPPTSFVAKPLRWLKHISDSRAKVSGGPNFAFDLCVKAISSQEKETLDLSSWHYVVSGGEPVRASTLENFYEYFAECGLARESLYPVLGMAENTLGVTLPKIRQAPFYLHVDSTALKQGKVIELSCDDEAGQTLVACGHCLENQKLIIVEPSSRQQCEPNQVGEIWLHGGSTAQGYWNNSVATEEAFHAYTADGCGPFYRSGDLGFIVDEQLFICGRFKDIIIIRGENYYPQDIEKVVEISHQALQQPNGCVAFRIEEHGHDGFGIIAELAWITKKINYSEVVETINKVITQSFGIIPSMIALIAPGTLEKTSSGKVQRRNMREKWRRQKLETEFYWEDQETKLPEQGELVKAILVAPKNQRMQLLNNHLKSRIAEIFQVKETSLNDEKQGFTDLGMDSMMAVQLSEILQRDLGSHYPLSETIAFDVANREKLRNYLVKSILKEFFSDESQSIVDGTPNTNETKEQIDSLDAEQARATLEKLLKDSKK